MSGGLLYLDSSAILKLIVPEPESSALFAELRRWPERVSSSLARLEVARALRRAAARPGELRRADAVLDRIALVRIDDPILARAATLDPSGLRSLDAIHLATALSLGSDLGALATYDRRLALAAASHGVRVVAP